MGASGMHHDACINALNATAISWGYKTQIDKAQSVATSKATSTAKDVLGDKEWVIVGTAMAAKAVKSKHLNFKLPNIGVADTISNDITPNSYGLTLQWRF